RSELGVIERTRRLHRKRRKHAKQKIVSLVGYTNAGKSTLFNTLSGAGVLAKDMLFATLDPTLRRVQLPGGGAFILSDTVGFISELPTQLIAAFRATLEEVKEADLILHVRDISSEAAEAQCAEVQRVLTEIGINGEEQTARIIEVWNKADLLPPEERARLSVRAKQRGDAVLLSASSGEGISDLLGLIARRLHHASSTRSFFVDHADGSFMHWLYENTEVLRRTDHENNAQLEVRLAPEREGELDRYLRRSMSFINGR
ncbi:MAG TPA: GTPase HflX, partial [Hyphomicrobiales bacterium]|nr:GTPase HflX [Hyphomicrobiales bacterium]